MKWLAGEIRDLPRYLPMLGEDLFGGQIGKLAQEEFPKWDNLLKSSFTRLYGPQTTGIPLFVYITDWLILGSRSQYSGHGMATLAIRIVSQQMELPSTTSSVSQILGQILNFKEEGWLVPSLERAKQLSCFIWSIRSCRTLISKWYFGHVVSHII